jgi:hypothetical protein
LTELARIPVEVEGEDEIIPPEELTESEAAWQDIDYQISSRFRTNPGRTVSPERVAGDSSTSTS